MLDRKITDNNTENVVNNNKNDILNNDMVYMYHIIIWYILLIRMNYY